MKTAQIVLRLEPSLREAIEVEAERDRRPMGALIRIVLSDWLEGRSQGERAAGA
jgi:hypothetical protein